MQYALDNFDENWDGQLQTGEIAAVTSIDCSGLGIVSLEGIGRFAKLQTLVANDNPISAIDLSQNTDLTRVELIRTSFEELAVEGLPRLETLLCDGLKENLPGPHDESRRTRSVEITRHPLRNIMCNCFRIHISSSVILLPSLRTPMDTLPKSVSVPRRPYAPVRTTSVFPPLHWLREPDSRGSDKYADSAGCRQPRRC